MVAALAYPELSLCKGIELLVDLADLGKRVCKKTTDLSKERGVACAPIEVVQGDMFAADWSDADIIMAASVCFSNEMLELFADKCKTMKKGSRILFMNYLPERPYIKEVASWKG
mmetsp:Transcript_23234/g.27273  ORF Transcript_23234/g.27273 Transcript_23234/m.27273 type:complete len:114 (-) Transcript_23234:75-416(-)